MLHHTWRVLRNPQISDGAILDELWLQISHGYSRVKIPDVWIGRATDMRGDQIR